MIVIYIIIGYLVIAAIIEGILNHYFEDDEEDNTWVAYAWPFVLVALPFIGISLLVKEVLDKLF